MALTFAAIKNAKGREKPYKLTDGDGLFLYVTPNGGRYWRMNYRHMGKQKTLAFGVYPDTGLAEAREQRDAARKLLAKGDDPSEKIKLDRFAATVAAANSFKAVADEWLVKVEREGRSAVTMKKLRWLLDFINASIGKRPVTRRTREQIVIKRDVRLDPAKRADRFVERWNKLSDRAERAYVAGDLSTQKAMRSQMADMAKSLERDPQMESILANRKRQLGIMFDSGRRLGAELAFNHGIDIGRGRGLGIGM